MQGQTSQSKPLGEFTEPPPIAPRPPQNRLDIIYLESIENLAQCDEQYCPDADLRYHTSLLYHILKSAKDEWKPVLTYQAYQDEDGLQKHLATSFSRYDSEKQVQKNLNEYRLRRWRNPVINFDAREWSNPLYYRGAGDLWRRLHQTQGRPTVLQCLDFAPVFHKLKKAHEKDPEFDNLTRQYTLSLFDHKTCVPGLQCPGLRPLMIWCMQNPDADPEQVEECLTTIPNIAQCSKPGFMPRDNSMEKSTENLKLVASGAMRQRLEAGRRMNAWLINAAKITSAQRPVKEKVVEEPKEDPKYGGIDLASRDQARQEFIRESNLKTTMAEYPRWNHEPKISPKMPATYNREIDRRNQYAPLLRRKIPSFQDFDQDDDEGNAHGRHDDDDDDDDDDDYGYGGDFDYDNDYDDEGDEYGYDDFGGGDQRRFQTSGDYLRSITSRGYDDEGV